MRLLLTLSLASMLFACASGPVSFEGSTPIAVRGELPAKPPRVEVTDNKIVIHEKIQFEYDKAVIRSESDSLLQEIAQTIKDNPHIKALRVEGHASSEGADEYNMKLSQARAEAVKTYLVEKGGISAEMLNPKGFGETQPIADNSTDAGKEANRRVEFIITKQDITTTKYEVDPKTGEKKAVETKTTTASKESK